MFYLPEIDFYAMGEKSTEPKHQFSLIAVLYLFIGPRQEIIAHFDCLLVRLPRYIHRHISWYASADVSCRRTEIRRNSAPLFFGAILIRKGWKLNKGGKFQEAYIFIQAFDVVSW